jgi:signal transduction histidine kinase
MTRDEALQALRRGSASERLEAARVLAEIATPADLRRLVSARQREVDHYVTVALDDAIRRASQQSASTPATDEAPIDESLLRSEEYARGFKEALLMVVHELGTSIGRVRSAARTELDNFDKSTTRSRLEHLDDLFAAVERIGVVTGVPEYEEFDLAGHVMDIAASVADQTEMPVETTGQEPLLVVSDKNLVEFAVGNGIRNACEAVRSLPAEDRPPVIVSWGKSDKEFWVSVIDRGPGLPEDLQDPFAFAESRKQNHLGAGLSLARRAIRTLGGTATLRDREGGGAYFEVRWPHSDQTVE